MQEAWEGFEGGNWLNEVDVRDFSDPEVLYTARVPVARESTLRRVVTKMQEAWEGFEGGNWLNEVDVRDFIQKNYTPYEGDESFLVGPTERTTKLWDDVMALLLKEREQGGVLDMDTKVVTGITSHPAGYIDAEHPERETIVGLQTEALLLKEREQGGVLDMDTKVVTGITSHPAGYIDAEHPERETIVGLQTDAPLKRALHVNGGIRIACQAAAQHGYEVDPEVVDFYTNKRKTHNAGVFDAYTPEMRACRSAHIITGLPDGYGRGRIIGDYRRVALYGVDYLIKDKEAQKASTPSVMTEETIRDREELSEQIRSLKQLIELGIYGVDYLIKDKEAQKASTPSVMTEETIRDREELSEQIRSLKQLIELGNMYGFDISRPAANTQEAIQWMYLAYLAAVKDQNGAAMSIGRTSTFIDIYAERDLKNGTFNEEQIQEFVDHFIMKLRMVKFARTPEYQNLFSGDPQWVTESIGGMGVDGRTLVTKMSYRYLHTLENMGTSPEPNLTVLWSTHLPQAFKEFCAKTSIASSSIQYENDDVMRVYHGDDYAIACCVSSMRIGKEMQFFGARANLAKCLLYALNGGVDEVSKKQVGPKFRPVEGDTLDFDDVMAKYNDMMKWLAGVYVNTLNVIHYMHDKYCYESIQMALHDKDVHRWFATGIAGLSVVADSLSAIKYAKVHPVRDENGVIVDFNIEGDFPKYGNDDDRVDVLAHDIVHQFMEYIRMNDTYRNSVPTTPVPPSTRTCSPAIPSGSPSPSAAWASTAVPSSPR